MSNDWLNFLSLARRAHAEQMIESLKHYGALDSQELVKREFTENMPQWARFLFLRQLGGEIDHWFDMRELWVQGQIERSDENPQGMFARGGRALKRMLEAGVSLEDIGNVAQMVAFEAISETLRIVEEGDARSGGADLPTWALIEVNAGGEATSRVLSRLKEDLLALDEPGREAYTG